MSPRRWTITVHATGQPRDVDVVLYDKVADMRRAASRFARVVGEAPGSFSDAAGVCHGFQRIRVYADGTEKEHPLVSIVRLHKGALSPLIVSHEMSHAAQHVYGLDMVKDDDLARNHFDAGNEDYAHLFGELFAAAWNVLAPPTDN